MTIRGHEELLINNQRAEQSNPTSFLKQMFAVRNLGGPTGQPLYLYHLTITEYETLKDILKNSQPYKQMSKPSVEWCASFCLFVAEWFRRECALVEWSWNPIYAILEYEQLSDIRDITHRGIDVYWKRQILTFESSNHRNYLGSVFKEGGFPSNLLAQDNNRYQAVFKKIVAKYGHYRHHKREVNEQLISFYTQSLPQAFQEHETQLLIADMAEQLVHLVEVHQLDEVNNPAEYLSRNFPKWRENFPLPLESAVAEQFLNQLLQESSSELKHVKVKQKEFSCTNFLNRHTQQIFTEIFLPENLEITLQDVKGVTPRVELMLYEGHQVLAKLGMASFTQRPEPNKSVNLRIGAQTRLVGRKHFSEDLAIVIQNKDQILYKHQLSQTALDIGIVPIAFVKQDDELCSFLGQASFKTPEPEIILFLPKGFTFVSQECVKGHLADALEQRVFIASGEIRILGDNEDQYTIYCSKYSDKSESVELCGDRLPWVTSPSLAFKGKPTVKYIDPGLASRNSQLNIYADGKLLSEFVGTANYGVKTITVKNGNNDIVLRRKIIVFPEDFEIKLDGGNQPNEARVNILTASKIFLAGISSDHQTITYKRIANTTIAGYGYSLRTEDFPPETFKLSIILGFANPIPIEFHLPFPSLGVTLYDKDKLPFKKKLLTIDELLGSRLCFFVPENKSMTFWLTMRLKTKLLSDLEAPYYKWKFQVSGTVYQQSLIYYREQIEELLAITDDLDAKVILEVIGDRIPLTYEIRHYQANFLKNAQGYYSLKDSSLMEEKIVDPVLMVLGQPEQAVIPLEAIYSENVHTGQYSLPKLHDVGPCLIIPRDATSLKFRPSFVMTSQSNTPNEVTIAQTLHTAVRLFHPASNNKIISNYLSNMVNDLQNSGWMYLNHLYSRYQHLPLVTFQVWKEIARNDSALTLAIWLLDFENDIYKRLEKEFGLVWELIPITSWKLAIRKTYDLYLSLGIQEKHVKAIIEKRYERLSQEIATLSMPLKDFYFDELKLSPLPQPMLNALINMIHLQSLLRDQVDGEEWPAFFQTELSHWYETEDNDIPIHPKIHLPQHSSVVLLPIYLAMKNLGKTQFLLAPSAHNHSLVNQKIRQLRDFDPVWFNEIFELTISYFLHSQGS